MALQLGALLRADDDQLYVPFSSFAVFVIGPLCLWTAYAIYHKKAYRHILQVCLTFHPFIFLTSLTLTCVCLRLSI